MYVRILYLAGYFFFTSVIDNYNRDAIRRLYGNVYRKNFKPGAILLFYTVLDSIKISENDLLLANITEYFLLA
jgi:hypothetical protein